MSSPPYHGGYSLDDRIQEMGRRRSLREVQDELDQALADREIVITPELPEGWCLEWVHLREEGEGWARFGGRRIVIMAAGKQYDPRDFRWREPPLPVRPNPYEEDTEPLATAAEEPPIAPAASLPPGFEDYGGHSLAVIIEGWRRGHALPIVQKYLVALRASGDIVLSQDFSGCWWLEHDPLFKSAVIVTVNSCLYPSEIRCLFPRDARLVGPLQLWRLRKPAALPDVDPPSKSSSVATENDVYSDGRERTEWKTHLVPLLIKLRAEGKVPTKNAAFHVVVNQLKNLGLEKSTSAIYAGLDRHCPDWWPD